MAITIKNRREIEAMRAAGRVVAEVHQRIEAAIAPGVTPLDLDEIARDTIREHGATSNFFGHHGFPGHICASVNDQIVHGIPSKRPLRPGDIISVDIGAIVDGFHGDSAWTYAVGDVDPEIARLLADTEVALSIGIEQAVAGNRLGAIGAAVEAYGRERGYGIVKGYGGHGIGRQMWEEPHIPNHGDPRKGPVLRAGMTLAIEPMFNAGGEATRVMEDNWTVVTADGSWSAHFEHTVAIMPGGEPSILTERPIAVVH
ncbi:MAG TPA: type I methionyl aminopeptidase [Thermomicrobiales bacterium]|nr:type I methionyl aminopeptidase [Thermomicrobiales bacterium]